MQLDVFDEYASYIVKDIVEIYKRHAKKYLTEEKIEEYREYIDVIGQWDYQVTKESIGAGMYLAWEHYFLRTFIHEAIEEYIKISF